MTRDFEYVDREADCDDCRPYCPACGSRKVHLAGGLAWCDVCGFEREEDMEQLETSELVAQTPKGIQT